MLLPCAGKAGLTFFTSIKVGKLLGQALGIGLAVALVEEVLFRAWLQEEIAVDMGFHKAVFISALAFALVHWYAPYQLIVCMRVCVCVFLHVCYI